MNKNIQKLMEPTRLFLLVLIVFATITFFVSEQLAFLELGVVVVLLIYSSLAARRRRREMVKYIEDVTYNTESAKNNTLMNFPLPIVVFRMDGAQIIWGNQIFFNLFSGKKPSFEATLTEMVPGFTSKWLMEGKKQYPGLVQINNRKYQLHGNIIRAKDDEKGHHGDFMGITYWVDVTEFDDIKLEYENSRPVVAILLIDNFDELMKNLPDRRRDNLRGSIDDLLEQWAQGKNGLLRRYDRDRYMFLFEERYLKQIVDTKFAILNTIHSISSPAGVHATLSIGVGKDGSGFEEDFSFAQLATEMALQRGGDQAVIKNKYNFEFFGGRGMEVENRTKVRSRVTANALSELIRNSSQVLVMGHKQSDLDSIGGAVGICCIARKLGCPAHIVVDPEANVSKKLIAELKETPEYVDAFLSPEEALIKADGHTLLVVVDTNRPEQVQSLSLLESCTHIAVIDHHRRAASYIQNADLTFHEPYASSVCELMSELLQELVLRADITKREAEAVLSGIVLDTKNFTIRTGERTFDAAAFLKRMGADTSEVKKLLQNDMDHTVAKYSILQQAKVYRGNIAIAVPETVQDRVVAAQAADELLNISGIDASIVAYPSADGGVMVSARSMGDINVQLLLERLGGGGNASAAGAQIKDISLQDAVDSLIASIDEYFS